MSSLKKTILVVDDEADFRAMVTAMCEYAGYSVVEAGDGLEALKQTGRVLPDLILCDVTMPNLDGYGLIAALRENPETSHIPFIFLTGKNDPSDLRAGMQLGADDYLTKPFKETQLLTAIEIRLKKREDLMRQVNRRLEEIRISILDSLPHELRTPLHGILGVAEILKDSVRELDPGEVEEMATRIQKSAIRLRHLLENFVLYAELQALESDEEKLREVRQERTASLRAAVESVVHERAQKWNRAADLTLSVEECVPAAGEPHLRKLIEEVIDNAFKFSETGTPVTVTSTVAPGQLTLVTTDAGRGFSMAHIHDLGCFAQFDRRMHEQQGMGMGLAITRRLAEIYDGTFHIESSPGKGTRVTITLPTIP